MQDRRMFKAGKPDKIRALPNGNHAPIIQPDGPCGRVGDGS